MASPHGFGDNDDDADLRSAQELFADEQLVLTDGDDERLPWLEASDFDEDDRGYDNGKIAGVALVALLLFGLIAAGAWWFTRAGNDAELQPQGSVIAAAEGPYKVRPEVQGGKTFEGTGDTSFAVGEGQRREGVLADDPTPTPSTEATPDASPSATATPSPALPSGPVVQVGAYATRSAAQNGWVTLMRQTTKLNGVKHRIVQGTADIGVVYRLQAVPGDLVAARSLCAGLKEDGVACQVKR